jgi:tRNA pseudouridine13 synthase
VEAKEYDAHIGMEVFTTQSPGIGGRLKKTPEDFVVQEIGLDGSIAPLEPTAQEYPDQSGKFTVFFLVKRNLDSIQAIRKLSRSMGVSYKRFSYAGIKDRRAVTSQRVSFRGEPQELLGREISAVQVLHPHRATKTVVPGALQGNRFAITIREVEQTTKKALTYVESIHQEIQNAGGALNFFGPQRFGIIRPNTHLIGKQLVLENFKEAIRILLQGDAEPTVPNERASNGKALYGRYERAVTHYLNKHPGDYKGAFQVLPKDPMMGSSRESFKEFRFKNPSSVITPSPLLVKVIRCDPLRKTGFLKQQPQFRREHISSSFPLLDMILKTFHSRAQWEKF